MQVEFRYGLAGEVRLVPARRGAARQGTAGMVWWCVVSCGDVWSVGAWFGRKGRARSGLDGEVGPVKVWQERCGEARRGVVRRAEVRFGRHNR